MRNVAGGRVAKTPFRHAFMTTPKQRTPSGSIRRTSTTSTRLPPSPPVPWCAAKPINATVPRNTLLPSWRRRTATRDVFSAQYSSLRTDKEGRRGRRRSRYLLKLFVMVCGSNLNLPRWCGANAFRRSPPHQAPELHRAVARVPAASLALATAFHGSRHGARRGGGQRHHLLFLAFA